MSFSSLRFLEHFGRKTATGDLSVSAVPAVQDLPTLDDRISRHAELLSKQLLALRERLFPPESRKTLRTFTSGEAARLIGVSDSYLRQLSSEGLGPAPQTSSSGRRSYTLAQINELRRHLAANKPKEAARYLPHRRDGEQMQTIACVNFKGGSGKTTTRRRPVYTWRSFWLSKVTGSLHSISIRRPP
jgi:MerR family regulatory protein